MSTPLLSQDVDISYVCHVYQHNGWELKTTPKWMWHGKCIMQLSHRFYMVLLIHSCPHRFRCYQLPYLVLLQYHWHPYYDIDSQLVDADLLLSPCLETC